MGKRDVGATRRDFLKSAAVGAAAAALAPRRSWAREQAATAPAGGGKLKLKYAPGLMFEAHAGKDPADQLRFIADQGFTAWFDNGLMGRPAAEQESLARESARLGLTIGPFVVYADFAVESFVIKDAAIAEMLTGRFKTAIETSRLVPEPCCWAPSSGLR